jgi:IS5 family transposase
MDAIIPWDEWLDIIKPYYYKGEVGNKPFELRLMLRIHLLQKTYSVSAMVARLEILDSRASSEACGVDSSDQVPIGIRSDGFAHYCKKEGNNYVCISTSFVGISARI